MAGMKSLAKDTAIYGLSSILGRFLNWGFVFLYVNVLKTTAEYGIVTNLYAYMALLLIILTYGMETGFFRFANDKEEKDPQKVYTTGLISLATTSTLFFVLVWIFLSPLSRLLGYPEHEDYVLMMALIIAIDAFTALPFAYLRYQRRPIRFAAVKLLSIFLNIALNLFFILLCPWLYGIHPEWISWFFDPDFLVGYILVSNVISSGVVLLVLFPEIFRVRYRFNGRLLSRMLKYSFPLLILGIAGIMNQTFDKMFYPVLAGSRPDAMSELGIYGAVYKIAIVMVMFTQAFRFAYEPFIFARNKEAGNENKKSYSEAMKYFIIFGLFIFLAVMFYIDIVRFFMPATYCTGLKVVPEGGAHRHAGRALLRHLLQPVVVVQAHRPHPVGGLVLAVRVCHYGGNQYRGCAPLRLHGVCLGGVCLLPEYDAGFVLHRAAGLSHQVRVGQCTALHAAHGRSLCGGYSGAHRVAGAASGLPYGALGHFSGLPVPSRFAVA